MIKNYFSDIFKNSEKTETDLSSPFKICMTKDDFVKIKTKNLYKKILSRCYSRSEGATDEKKIQSLYDSSEASAGKEGLISLIAGAMFLKKEIIIIYNAGVVREAKNEEEKKQIRQYYEEIEKQKVLESIPQNQDTIKNKNQLKGIILNFQKYELTDVIKAYLSMVYDILESMNTQIGITKSLQIKISNLRSTVSVAGKDEPIKQAQDINDGLKAGKSALLDKNDEVLLLKIDSDSVKNAMSLVNSLIASELGVSLSFVSGELTTGMSATGEADANADEYGFQDFFNSIFKPACDNLYDWKLRFVSDDWRYFNAMIGNLIIVENSALLSDKQKKAFADRLMPIENK